MVTSVASSSCLGTTGWWLVRDVGAAHTLALAAVVAVVACGDVGQVYICSNMPRRVSKDPCRVRFHIFLTGMGLLLLRVESLHESLGLVKSSLPCVLSCPYKNTRFQKSLGFTP